MDLQPDDFSEEKFKLFENYQHHVHHESLSEISRHGFRRFLCSSPLQRSQRILNGTIQHLGSFHQCYRFDGRLIALAVLDLLPHGVSAVYFIYHQDFEKWSFGKISALREAALAAEGGYQHYYMGYYIHSCIKMRYKCDYKQQYVLDPETHNWDPLDDEVKRLLDAKPFVSMSRQRQLGNDHESAMSQVDRPSGAINLSTDTSSMPKAVTAAAAVRRGLSLFNLKIPGVLTSDEVVSQVDLDNLLIKISESTIVKTEVSVVTDYCIMNRLWSLDSLCD